MAKNSSTMLGRNTITPPTPPMMPSTSSDFRGLLLPAGQRPLMAPPSQPKPWSIRSISGLPRLKVRVKTTYMRVRKMGTPQTGCMATRSMRSETLVMRAVGARQADLRTPPTNP